MVQNRFSASDRKCNRAGRRIGSNCWHSGRSDHPGTSRYTRRTTLSCVLRIALYPQWLVYCIRTSEGQQLIVWRVCLASSSQAPEDDHSPSE
jgi:hypothetical protein